MTQMTAVSLFAGIEGLGRAFHLNGVRVVAAVEIDVAARGVIHDRTPDTTLFTDVCEVTADELRAAGFDPDNGILLGGWPCQDLSVAGRRLGLGGARSGLFWEVVRILADLRPRWFCLENVPGLLSAVCCCPGLIAVCGDVLCCEPHSLRGGACGYIPGAGGRCMELHGGAMGAVLGALAELGYGVAYRVLDAQYLGVPQRRRRVLLVGCLGDWAAPAEVLLEPEGGGGDPAPGRTAGAGVAPIAALSASGGGADDNDATGGRLIAGPLQARGTDGRGHRVEAEGAANGHLIPTLTAGMGSNVGHPGDAGKDDIILAVAATLTAGSASGRTPGRRREDDQNIVVAPAPTARYGKGADSDATDSLLPVAFDTAQITSAENRANPKPGDPPMPLAATGSPHVAYVPLGGEGIAHALTAEGHDASEDGTGRGTPLVPVAVNPIAFDWKTDGSDRARPNISERRTSTLGTTKQDAVATTTAVRRLTPTECERLQGYPDGWTATSWGKPQADSPRYRQLGNSVAVPVFAWVARRMVPIHNQLFAMEANDGDAR